LFLPRLALLSEVRVVAMDAFVAPRAKER
jgi:hypothetical protein